MKMNPSIRSKLFLSADRHSDFSQGLLPYPEVSQEFLLTPDVFLVEFLKISFTMGGHHAEK